MRPSARLAIALGCGLLSLAAGLAYPLLARGQALLDATWQAPWFLLGLALVPLLGWWGTYGQDRRRPHLRMGTLAALKHGPLGWRVRLRDVPGCLRAVAFGLMVLALSRPVSVLQDRTTDEKGIDIVLVMDLSGSMRAVLDAAPSGQAPGSPPSARRPTRLDVSKVVVQDFIGRRVSDRIGVVVFGKSAYVLSPPTLDYPLLDQLVSRMTLNVIDGSATAIGDALGTAVARLRRSDAQSKAIVLLTDGDSNAGSIAPEYATQLAQTVGCKVYTIQIGNEDEVDVEDGLDLFGHPRYIRQRFPVNPKLLASIAQQTGGETYVATDAQALADSMHRVLDSLEKTRFEASLASYEELFPLLLVPGVLLLGLEVLLRAWFLRRFP